MSANNPLEKAALLHYDNYLVSLAIDDPVGAVEKLSTARHYAKKLGQCAGYEENPFKKLPDLDSHYMIGFT